MILDTDMGGYNEWHTSVSVPEDVIETFRKLVVAHDLTYHFSDDHRSYVTGEKQYVAIKELAKKLPPGVAAEIWNESVRKKLNPNSWNMFAWKEDE